VDKDTKTYSVYDDTERAEKDSVYVVLFPKQRDAPCVYLGRGYSKLCEVPLAEAQAFYAMNTASHVSTWTNYDYQDQRYAIAYWFDASER